MHEISSKLKWLGHVTWPHKFSISAIVLLGAIKSTITVYMALVSKSLIDAATAHNPSLLLKKAVLFASLIALQIVINIGNSLIKTRCAYNLTHSIQESLYDHLLFSDWLAFTKYHSANLITRLTSDVNAITTLVTDTLPNCISFVIMITIAFFTLLAWSPSIALVAVTISPFFIIISKLFSKRYKEIYLAAQDTNVAYRSFIQESLQNIIIIKSFCQEAFHLSTLKGIQNKQLNLAIKQNLTSTFTSCLLELGSWISYFIVFCWGAYNLSKGIGTFGTFTALIQLFMNIRSPLGALAMLFPSVIAAIASTQRLMVLEAIPSEPHKLSLEALNQKAQTACQVPAIELHHVGFSYVPEAPILKNINLTIKPGQIIGIVGPSGEGKTTLIRLLLGLIEPTEGKILLRDPITQEARPLTPDERHYFSYVPQGNTLFSGTIADNLRYGNHHASLQELQTATELGRAQDFINHLENTWDTELGEKGVGVSEGQAQRLAISRALLKHNSIYLFDEATSALDAETEIQVLDALKELKKHSSCIIITHRPSALDICDQVVRLKQGYLYELSS